MNGRAVNIECRAPEVQLPGLEDKEWALKIVVLLHDPPWKAYVVARARGVLEGPLPKLEELLNSYGVGARPWERVGEIFGVDVSKLERHELEALGVIATLVELLRALSGRYGCKALSDAADAIVEVVRDRFDLVKEADGKASTVDRLVVDSLRAKLGIGAVSLQKFHYVNPFNPKVVLELEPSRYDVKALVAEYLRRLFDSIAVVLKVGLEEGACNKLSSGDVLKLLYNMLYALVEPVWYSVAHGFALPAHTLFPTHTVFDHLYASALASNMVLRSTWCILMIDVPGIQEFVAKGRKTRDYWAGSWLLSALVWKTVEEALIDKFGPDVLVSPAPTFNMFYLAYLVTLVKRLLGDAAADKLDDMLHGYTLAWLDRWPSQPVIPATITAILPEACTTLYGRLDKLLSEVLDSVWCRVAKAVFESDEFREWLLEDSDVENLMVVDGEDYLGEYLQAVARKAPFRVIVACVDRGEVLSKTQRVVKEIESELSRVMPQAGIVTPGFRNKLAELVAFHIAIRKVVEKLDEVNRVRCDPTAVYSKTLSEISRRFYEGKGRFERCSVCGSMIAAVKAHKAIGPFGTDYGSVIDERETLCPVCLVRRMAPFTLWRVVSEGLGYQLRHVPQMVGGILSTHGLACFWSHVLRVARSGGACGTRVVFFKPLAARVLTGELRAARDALAKTLSARLGVDYNLLVNMFQELGQTLEEVCEPKKVEKYCSTEYVVVRGDGDRIGKGYWRGALGMKTNEYIHAVYEHVLRAATGANRQRIEALERLHTLVMSVVMDVLKRSCIVQEDATVPLTPSFIFTFSRSLMATAVLDSIIVPSLGGVLVFAGGDDVYAFLPLDAPSITLEPEEGKRQRLSAVFTALLAAYAGIYDMYASYAPAGRLNLDRYLDELVKTLLLDKFDMFLLKSRNSPGVVGVLATRLNYWGVVDSWDGSKLNPGFHVLPGITVAATIAYGRSYGVNVAHYREPLWRVYRAALRGEEEKDNVRLVGVGVVREKDVAVYMMRGNLETASILPLKMPKCGSRIGLEEDDPMYTLPLFYAMVGTVFSRSLVYDALEPDPTNPWYKSLVDIADAEEATRLYLHIMDRNLSAVRPLGLQRRDFIEWLRGLTRRYVEARVERVNVKRGETLMHHVFLALRALIP